VKKQEELIEFVPPSDTPKPDPNSLVLDATEKPKPTLRVVPKPYLEFGYDDEAFDWADDGSIVIPHAPAKRQWRHCYPPACQPGRQRRSVRRRPQSRCTQARQGHHRRGWPMMKEELQFTHDGEVDIEAMREDRPTRDVPPNPPPPAAQKGWLRGKTIAQLAVTQCLQSGTWLNQAVMSYLIDRANEKNGACYPSNATMAKDLRSAERSVRRATSFWRRRGYRLGGIHIPYLRIAVPDDGSATAQSRPTRYISAGWRSSLARRNTTTRHVLGDTPLPFSNNNWSRKNHFPRKASDQSWPKTPANSDQNPGQGWPPNLLKNLRTNHRP
jgi:hypothetical protein